MMEQRSYRIRFITPAFMGNAEQAGQWRTPPIKALLRQWWRMAWSESKGFSGQVDAMRKDEGRLFGNAEGKGSQSQLRMRIDRWDKGRQNQWVEDLRVFHKEAGRGGGGASVGSQLYLGYGPLMFDKQKGTKMNVDGAIGPGETVELRIAFPKEDAPLIERALELMDRFGTLGSRSRNGWGSFQLEGMDTVNKLPLRDWSDCMALDWPHAIGSDDKGALVWQTGRFDSWPDLMKKLAEIKIGMRTHFEFNSGDNTSSPESRHWISYPVTNHHVKNWGRNSRLPNTLRFKAINPDDGKVQGLIFHVPCKPPRKFRPDSHERDISKMWQELHSYLDSNDHDHDIQRNVQ